MSKLNLHTAEDNYILAAQLRRAMSGIVAGNVKATAVKAIADHGPFELSGDPSIMDKLDTLLTAFVAQKRMKIDHERYVPCYKLVK